MAVLIRDADVLDLSGLRKNSNIFVDDGRIVQVSSDIPAFSKIDYVIEGKGKLAIPGLINAHVHTEETLFANSIPDTANHIEWFQNYALPYYGALTQEDAYWSTLFSQALMLMHGVTCYADSANLWPLADAKAAERCGIRAFIGMWNCDLNTPFARPTDKCLEQMENLLRKLSKSTKVRAIASLIGVNTCSDELYKGTIALAKKHKTLATSHEASGHEDVVKCVKRTGKRPIEHLASIGFLTRQTLISHATDLSDKEVRLIKANDCAIAACPVTELKKGKGLWKFGKLVQLISSNVRICVGTDNANSSNNFDPIKSALFLSLLAKDYALNPSIVNARSAFCFLTKCASDIFSLNTGVLQPNFIADLVLLEKEPFLLFGDPYQALLFCDQPKIDLVMVGGEVVYLNGKLLKIDFNEVLKEVEKRSQRIAKRVLDHGHCKNCS
ncbi:hypothetical protein B9Q11_04205 [Candidatus Marsarchaeota G2 archaeon ECH_B_SAG-F08]|uniref:Amidohydrolase-related domain-containing protein n=2 Tax=Candidatus Marsarchaeota group 2 TaxID=2203771 RepID=A0A2R6C0X8_9ARCH|nr:MAG: hypothetical protein B9Q11_04205 [Candidatus Marsarchaeota G2 archaeon ECH_B_SAG-F08]PSO04511.1 MAG: hypothetical protein B9Q12_02230 [Candidatus Marsarchaeota G2 archaeon ECH_B_SAG-G06]